MCCVSTNPIRKTKLVWTQTNKISLTSTKNKIEREKKKIQLFLLFYVVTFLKNSFNGKGVLKANKQEIVGEEKTDVDNLDIFKLEIIGKS